MMMVREIVAIIRISIQWKRFSLAKREQLRLQEYI